MRVAVEPYLGTDAGGTFADPQRCIGSLESLSTIDDSRARSLWSALVLLAVVESALLEATTIRANKQAKQRGSKKESLRFVSKLFQLIKHAN